MSSAGNSRLSTILEAYKALTELTSLKTRSREPRSEGIRRFTRGFQACGARARKHGPSPSS